MNSNDLKYEYARDRSLNWDNPVNKDYFNYLKSLVNFDGYEFLCQKLHEIDYFWIILGDDNRGEDGRQLRLDFERLHSGLDFSDIDCCPPSVLEVLIGMALRMSDLTWAPNNSGPQPDEMFGRLIDNLGLSDYFNENFWDSHLYRRSVDGIVRTWLDHEYDPDGTGSPFPLKTFTCDFRDRSLWEMMDCWLGENYPQN